MVINYPNGQPFKKSHSALKKTRAQNTIYGNRGMSLEDEINESNKYYLEHGIAVIHKNRFQSKSLTFLIRNEAPRLSAKHISNKHRRLTTMASIMENTSISKRKKQKQSFFSAKQLP